MTIDTPDTHARLLADPALFAPTPESWRRIAGAVGRRTGAALSPETALWVAVELCLERHWYQPYQGDHLRDAAGFLVVLANLIESTRETGS